MSMQAPDDAGPRALTVNGNSISVTLPKKALKNEYGVEIDDIAEEEVPTVLEDGVYKIDLSPIIDN